VRVAAMGAAAPWPTSAAVAALARHGVTRSSLGAPSWPGVDAVDPRRQLLPVHGGRLQRDS
jgi:hypothetical protein